MRHVLALIGIVCVAGLSAAAQGVPNNSLLLAMPFSSPFTTSDGSNDAIAQPEAAQVIRGQQGYPRGD